VLAYLRPWDFYPELESWRLTFWIGNIGLGLAVIRFAARGRFTLLRGPELWLLLAFFVMVAASRVLAEAWFGGAIETMSTFMPTITICALIWLNVDSLKKLKTAAAVVVIASLALVGFTIAAYHYGMHTDKFILAQRTDDGEGGEVTVLGRVRALGSLNDPNDFGQALTSAIPLLWPLWRKGRNLRNFALIMLPTAVLVYGIFLTRSRGAVLAILVVVLMSLRDRMTRFRLAVPVMAAFFVGATLLALGGTGGREISADDESAAGRIDAWRSGIRMLLERPLTGVGYGRFADHNDGLAAHNSFVNCFAELGILGYFCWTGLLIVLYCRLGQLRVNSALDGPSADIHRWANALRASMLGCMTAAFFLSRTYAPTVYLVVAFVMALHAASQEMEEPPDADVGPFIGRTVAATLGSIAGIYVLVKVVG
jgi:hypothetical protein